MKKHLLTNFLVILMLLLICVSCGANSGKIPEQSMSQDSSVNTTESESVPKQEQGTPSESEDEKSHLKILAIGNSFSRDGMEYLWDICKASGYEKVTLGNLYIGGCTLNKHWTNISQAKEAYTYYKNTRGIWNQMDQVSVRYAMEDEAWDIITVQQESGSSGQPDTYGDLDNILKWIEKNKTNSEAKIYWHMTWAYAQDSTHKSFPKYNSNQQTMYRAITDTVQAKILTDNRIDGVIPSGTAIQNLRSSYVGDTVTRDGYHLHKGIGRYTAAMTWFAAITGKSIDSISWMPSSYSSLSEQLDVIKESVDHAIQKPYEVTASQYLTVPK